jgi:hypothetical protein
MPGIWVEASSMPIFDSSKSVTCGLSGPTLSEFRGEAEFLFTEYQVHVLAKYY